MKKALIIGVLLLAAVNPFTLSWIASLYIAEDPLQRSDAIVPLRGSAEEERLRLAEALKLARKGYARLLLVSANGKPYYGVPVRTLIDAYLRQQGFTSQRVRYCENLADSTLQEAGALLDCLRKVGAKTVIIVTSEYHSRRARFVFRRVFADSGILVRMHPAYNPEYFDTHWWRRRRWAKTFVTETLSMMWARLEQLPFADRLRRDPPKGRVAAAGN